MCLVTKKLQFQVELYIQNRYGSLNSRLKKVKAILYGDGLELQPMTIHYDAISEKSCHC